MDRQRIAKAYAQIAGGFDALSRAFADEGEAEQADPTPIRSAPPERPFKFDEQSECPTHHRADPSQYGGVYCKSKLADGSWCKWQNKSA